MESKVIREFLPEIQESFRQKQTRAKHISAEKSRMRDFDSILAEIRSKSDAKLQGFQATPEKGLDQISKELEHLRKTK